MLTVITCEAIHPDGSAWCSYTFPLEHHEHAVESPEAEVLRFRDAVKRAVDDEGVVLGDPPLRFTKSQMVREEYDAIPIVVGGSRSMDNFLLAREGSED